MIRLPKRDCPIIIDGYMAELKGYGRLCGSGRIADIVQMMSTFGIKPGADCVRFYRHVRWADGREWTKRVHDVMDEIPDRASVNQATTSLVNEPVNPTLVWV